MTFYLVSVKSEQFLKGASHNHSVLLVKQLWGFFINFNCLPLQSLLIKYFHTPINNFSLKNLIIILIVVNDQDNGLTANNQEPNSSSPINIMLHEDKLCDFCAPLLPLSSAGF